MTQGATPELAYGAEWFGVEAGRQTLANDARYREHSKETADALNRVLEKLRERRKVLAKFTAAAA